MIIREKWPIGEILTEWGSQLGVPATSRVASSQADPGPLSLSQRPALGNSETRNICAPHLGALGASLILHRNMTCIDVKELAVFTYLPSGQWSILLPTY